MNPSYTDYGGTLFDKAAIAWCLKNYPDDILHEKTSWNGENAVIFGEPAMLLNKDTSYADELPFIEEYDEISNKLEQKGFELLAKEYPEECRNAVIDYLMENAHGYWGIDTSGLDYGDEFDEDIKEYLKNLGFSI